MQKFLALVLTILCLSLAGALPGQTVENPPPENSSETSTGGEIVEQPAAPPQHSPAPTGPESALPPLTMPGLSELKGGYPDQGTENPANVNPGDLPEYRIGSGDVLRVSVWREPEVSVDAVAVRSDGKITLPLIREIYAVGLTPVELEALLTREFARFINGPAVTVIVREINSHKVYLVGGVVRPGSIFLRTPMTVLQVLAEAGGLTDFAKKKRIYIIRKQGGQESRIQFNYEAVLKGNDPEQNIPVRPGDTIVVPE